MKMEMEVKVVSLERLFDLDSYSVSRCIYFYSHSGACLVVSFI